MNKKYFVTCFIALSIFAGKLALAGTCGGTLITAGCVNITSKDSCNGSYEHYYGADVSDYVQCGWDPSAYANNCLARDYCEPAESICNTLVIKLENKSHATWTYESSTLPPDDSHGTDYLSLAAIDKDGNHSSNIYYKISDISSDQTFSLTYKNNDDNDNGHNKITFVITRHAAGSSGPNADSTISTGSMFAKQIGSENCTDYNYSSIPPSISFDLLDPPIQTVDIKIGFDSKEKATLASKDLFSLLDTNLMEGLNVSLGEPVKMIQNENVVTYTFEKLCTKEACGYT